MKAPVAQQPNETKAPGGRNCEIWKAEYSVQRSAASFRVISLIAAVFLLRPPVLMTIRFADRMHDSYDFERTEAKSSLRGKVIWGVKLNLMEVPWFEHHDASTIITSDFCITNQSYFLLLLMRNKASFHRRWRKIIFARSPCVPRGCFAGKLKGCRKLTPSVITINYSLSRYLACLRNQNGNHRVAKLLQASPLMAAMVSLSNSWSGNRRWEDLFAIVRKTVK